MVVSWPPFSLIFPPPTLETLDGLISFPFSSIFYFFVFFPLSLTHPYVSLTLCSNPSLDFFISPTMFYILCYAYSGTAPFFMASLPNSMGAIYSIISLSILVFVHVRIILLPAVLFSSDFFLFSICSFNPYILHYNFLRWMAMCVCQLLFKGQIADLEALRPCVEHVDCELKYRIIMLEVCWEAYVIHIFGSFPWAAQIP